MHPKNAQRAQFLEDALLQIPGDRGGGILKASGRFQVTGGARALEVKIAWLLVAL